IFARPGSTKSFADPKHTKACEHQANNEFQRILRHLSQRTMHKKTDRQDQDEGGQGTETGIEREAVSGPNGDDDEDDFNTFEKYRLEGGEGCQVIGSPIGGLTT